MVDREVAGETTGMKKSFNKLQDKRGSFFQDKHFEYPQPMLSWKMQFLPHISSQSSQVWQNSNMNGFIFETMFWVPTPLCYLEKCSICPISPLQVVRFENSWQEWHFSRLLTPQMLDPDPPQTDRWTTHMSNRAPLWGANYSQLICRLWKMWSWRCAIILHLLKVPLVEQQCELGRIAWVCVNTKGQLWVGLLTAIMNNEQAGESISYLNLTGK